jgi:hypothetical protein
MVDILTVRYDKEKDWYIVVDNRVPDEAHKNYCSSADVVMTIVDILLRCFEYKLRR